MAGRFGQANRGEDSPGPVHQFGATTRHLLTHLQARTLLFAVETREAFRELTARSVYTATGSLLLLIGYLLVLVCVVSLLADALHTRWQFVGLGAALVHLTGGGLVLALARRRFSDPLYEQTLSELEKDRQWLAGTHPASPKK